MKALSWISNLGLMESSEIILDSTVANPSPQEVMLFESPRNNKRRFSEHFIACVQYRTELSTSDGDIPDNITENLSSVSFPDRDRKIEELQMMFEKTNRDHLFEMTKLKNQQIINEMKIQNEFLIKLKELENEILFRDRQHNEDMEKLKQQRELQEVNFNMKFNEMKHSLELQNSQLQDKIKQLEGQLIIKDLQHQLNILELKNSLSDKDVELKVKKVKSKKIPTKKWKKY